MRTLTYSVPFSDDALPLRSILRGRLQLSYTLLKSLKWKEGSILLNGSPAHVNAIVHTGDLVSVVLTERRDHAPQTTCTLSLDIVYEDEDLLVLNKPANIAMHPRRAEPHAPNMASALAAYLGADSVAHFVSRLDKGTSGLFIAAKTGYIHDRLRIALHSDALRREYRAVAVGSVTPVEGSIDLPIGRADGSIIKRCVRDDGLPSRTEYRVLAKTERFSYLHLIPRTGRTHQLRIHMSALGFPLAGDWLYGTEDKSLISRPALHSHELWLRHPVTGRELHFTAPVPDDMLALLASGSERQSSVIPFCQEVSP